MAKRLPSVDVVLVGFGWTASIIAQELTDAGLQVLALERGRFRDTVPDFSMAHVQDELRYAVRNQNIEAPGRETWRSMRRSRPACAFTAWHSRGVDARARSVASHLHRTYIGWPPAPRRSIKA